MFSGQAFLEFLYHATQYYAILAAPDLPPDAWWMPLLVLFVLGLSATIDALTGTIPDWIIFFGLAAVLVTQGLLMDWPFAAEHLRLAILVGFGLWLLNALWRRAVRGDAFGMGDAKWTMLAVACFGFAPALFAWGTAACLAVSWMGLTHVLQRKTKSSQTQTVYFGPFLFIGLLIGLYWLRLR